MNASDAAAYPPREDAYLEERPEEPPFQRFWWNPPRKPVRTLTDPEVAGIGRQIQPAIARNVQRISSISSVKDGTWQVTSAVEFALRGLGYTCYTETPFTHELFDGHARVDIIAFAHGSPTVYVEIDSTPAAANLKKNALKLKAAWMMGAVPVWIGWHRFDPEFFPTDFPITKFIVLGSAIGMKKEAAYRRAAEKSLNELARVVSTIIAMGPMEDRCNLPTKTSTLCRADRYCWRHDASVETLGDLYPAQVLEQAIQIADQMRSHREPDDGPSIIEPPPEEFLPPWGWYD